MRNQTLVALTIVVTAMAYSGAADKPHAHSVKVPEPIARLVQKGDYEAARVALESNGENNHLLLAWLLLKQGRKDEGLRRLPETWKGRQPTPEELRQALAVVSDVSLPLAELTYVDFRNQFPEAARSPEVLLLIAMIKSRLSKFEDAQPLLDELIETGYTGEGLKQALLTLSTSLQTNGKPDEAIACLERLFKLYPEVSLDPAYKMQWAHQANSAGRPAEALEMVDRIESNYPDYTEQNRHLITLAKAIAYEELGDRQKSLDYWTHLQDLGTQFPPAKALATAAESKIRQFREEVEAEEKAKAATAPQQLSLEPVSTFRNRILIAVNAAVLCGLVIWGLARRFHLRRGNRQS